MGKSCVVEIRANQIQTLVFGGMTRLKFGSLLVLRFGNGDPRQALAGLSSLIGYGLDGKEKEELIQVGLTPCGLNALQVPVEEFPFAFRTQLGSEYHKRLLGDEGNSAPEYWLWNGDDCHLLVFCYANDQPRLKRIEGLVTALLVLKNRISMVLLDEDKEHFGFRDGISNPKISPEWNDKERLGEFVLGYPDIADEVPTIRLSDGMEIGKDGTYLVVRQLAQNVSLFWKTLQSQEGDPVELGAKLIGRWPDGRLLTQDPSFAKDLNGLQCPIGAHIRRANPRDSIVSQSLEPIDTSRHQLLRRGRPYGLPGPAEFYPAGIFVTAGGQRSSMEDERGLIFACLGADIARQFEHVQQSWLNNSKHNGLQDEVCPITSATRTNADKRVFTIPSVPVRRRIHDWPEVVTVIGSAYCFMPGKDAFNYLVDPTRNSLGSMG